MGSEMEKRSAEIKNMNGKWNKNTGTRDNFATFIELIYSFRIVYLIKIK